MTMLPNMGFGELLIILVLALLLFGAKRLPELARGVGKSFKAFKNGLQDAEESADRVTSEVKSLSSEEKDPPTPSR